MKLQSLLLTIITSSLLVSADILPGSTLSAANPNAKWSSPNSTFSLSFIPSDSNSDSDSFVAAITYNGGIPIWTFPVSDSTSTLSLLPSGNLILLNGSNNSTVWKTNTTAATSASLLDSGNLVLSNETGFVLWSTFDNPTDTIVPSQNFSLSRTLLSGSYTFQLLSSGNLTLKWNDSIVYWNKGLNSSLANNLTSPSLALQPIGILQLSDITLQNAVKMVYSSDYAEGTDILRFLKLDSDGNLRIYSSARGSGTVTVRWSAVSDQCQVFGFCGNFGVCSYNETNPVCGCPSRNFELIDAKDSRKGCKRKVEIENCPGSATMLQLDNAMFLTYPPEDSSSQVFSSAISACRLNCLNSGSCAASTSLSDGTGMCNFKLFPNFVSGYISPSLPSTSYVKVCGPVLSNPSLSSLTTEKRSWRLKAWIVVVVVICTVIGLAALEGVFWWFCCKNSRKFGGLATQYALLEYASGAPVQFTYNELKRATKSFKEKLGEGGFGAVYRGVLANRTIVAVKQLEGIEQGEKQFRMEVATISSTHHLNLVRLIGFCSEGRHRLLVYEFMKNGSLDNFLFSTNNQSGKWLSWEQRFNVALGTARGITYLHEECRDCIVHCDIKPENILLDENYNAKVSDFGLAKLVNTKDHRYRTLTSMRGTRGYLAPEWLANLPITSKSDIFSYGMVLLELVSGKRNFEVSDETNRKKFTIWAYEEFEKGNIMGIVDKRLNERELDMEQVLRAIQVSFWCIQEQPSHRPMMGKVVQMLEGVIEIEKLRGPKAVSEGLSVGEYSMNVTSNFTAPIASSSLSIQTPEISSSVSTRNVERVSSSLLQSGNK